ncbi:crotonase/enoyl-CoA hydratase family protein [Maritimibacter sp. DP1N21-5]|uniref:crotonase/enoyl-CoA hydratase family protein n=1 Tax=Maritimibacter sp. DP1N21-5 TaxID=2836867 RepID=UPI001C45F98F|nr:crotonase/enoyl-CoA hydratase family protein [Maritimibacter sp. DP1N21-5]MBV7410588.1 crotonase/enoyl-CoA hydratase family protein [Maritimibacter sp. DP1N21-5]
MSDRVTIAIEDHVAVVTMARHDKMNALDKEQIAAIVAAGREVSETPGVRAVVLAGGPRAFCAGLDMAAMASIAQDAQSGFQDRTHGRSNIFQATSMVWAECPVPVIAAINGYAFGGGFQIALGADIRIAAPDATFSIMEMKWGIIPDMGGMHLARRLLRGDVLRRLTYTAEVFDAEAALGWGVVTEVVDDPLARAMELARTIATRSPDAIRAAKALIDETELASPKDVLKAESRVQQELIGGANQMEAVMAGMQKRTPVFKD